ncbi:MAG TPA: beta-ketoacyl-[acyl-carrier-protein] synthase family protein [Candidatus Omnitrophota bacterium]|nr:beta-ketoacyl-[acyl-carrier-protein] synthase family protein [Candidatus Omnitrophota bacterium]HPN55640.1 beta-ketoacyl-[acyl-carrier-protein] synthase family protein [Candidatus Omnitrophota bacterium]
MVKQNQPNQRRVVVTGLGVVSSVGIGWQEFWKNLLAGKSGISEVTAFDTSKHDIHLAGEVKGFNPDDFISHNKMKGLPRGSRFAIAASRLALKDACLKEHDLRKKCAGVVLGTTMGEIQVVEQMVKHLYVTQKGFKAIRALMYPCNLIPSNVAHYFRVTGQNRILGNACAAGNFAIGYSFDLIRQGNADYMLAGGVDVLSRIAFSGFVRLFAMSKDKCQPFDKNRKGMMLGEGAGVLILESLENALERGAKIYAEVLGYGVSCDANHMTHPLVSGVEKAVWKSLRNSSVDITDVDYINAHGTGTTENDKAECQAFHNVFGERLPHIPVSSIKSMLGHSMGAASALEAVVCCLSIDRSEIPPTINYEEKDPECEIDCVPNISRKHPVKLALNNSQAFGGNNCSVILGKY